MSERDMDLRSSQVERKYKFGWDRKRGGREEIGGKKKMRTKRGKKRIREKEGKEKRREQEEWEGWGGWEQQRQRERKVRERWIGRVG